MSAASVRRDGPALVFTGPLECPAVPALWTAALPLLDGAEAIDLTGVPHLDSAGLALVTELQHRARAPLDVRGEPDGLVGLRAAYRQDTGY